MRLLLKLMVLTAALFSLSGATFQSYWLQINARDFGVVGDNVTDDTAAIQAAIDAAYTANIETVYLPHPTSCYKTTAPIYLDAPGNLRSNLNSPTIFAFSLNLTGDPGGGNHEASFGTRICPTSNSFNALIVGTGQAMRVSHLTVRAPSGSTAAFYRCGQSNGFSGIYIAGGGAGASRTKIEDVLVEDFFYGISTGLNNGALGDSNSFEKVFINNACIGIYISATQNFINDCLECNMSNITTGVLVGNGQSFTTVGGNWSATSAVSSGDLTLNSTSVVTATSVGNNFNYSFTSTLNAPAWVLNNPYTSQSSIVSRSGLLYMCIANCGTTTPGTNSNFWEPLEDWVISGLLDHFMIVTSHYGVIPMKITGYVAGTRVGTFAIWSNWGIFSGPQFNLVANGDLTAEVQAVSTLYATETVTVFDGGGIASTGLHVENPNAPTQLISSHSDVCCGATNRLSNVRFNFEPSMSNGPPSTGQQLARFYAAQTFPFISVTTLSAEIIDSQLNLNQNQPVVVEISAFGGGGTYLTMTSNSGVSPLAMRVISNGGYTNSAQNVNTTGLGGGFFDVSPFTASNIGANSGTIDADKFRYQWGRGTGAWGYRPAPTGMPCITPAQLTTLTGSLPAWTNNWPGTKQIVIGYPVIWGGQTYQLCDWTVGTQTHYLAQSTHHFYGYGQNITTTNVPTLSWSYKGQGTWVYADAETLSLMFAGLGIILNDGSTDHQYIVTGVYPLLGYFTVYQGDSANGGQLSGTKTSVITGTLIKQEAFNWVFP